MNASRVFIVINIAVFIAWQLAFKDRSDLYFMSKNFLVSWISLTDQRFWTLITSVFSHNSFIHLFLNMFVLNSFGPIVEMNLGRISFIKFYLFAGVFSSLCHAVVSNLLLHQAGLPALGASGAISGLIFVFSLLYPKEKIVLFGLIPLPAIWGALAFVGLDIWGLVAQAEGGGLPIGHGAHLGGAAAGLAYYLFFLRRKNFKAI